ncbi:MAG: phosphatase PAP2 family protein [Nitrospirae bacterium]|nr:MAG: phosphatase PAP2 family protein [Nitrospirota bacterium]
MSIVLSCTALGLIFWGLHQLDMPLIRFMRSVHQPWLEQSGDLLARLGSGAVLVAFSAALLVAGRLRMQPALFHAGLQGLVAHGASALVTQLLKHTIGRPRPRVTQEGEFQFEPSFVSGFDSFPSGHTSASFAVATVLARHFPRLGWIGYLAAALIACSRVWRGSHFPTDAVGGAAIGVLIGALLAYSYLDWLTVCSRMLTKLALALSAVFALFWPMVQSSSDHRGALWLTGAGFVAILVGLGLRWRAMFAGQSADVRPWSGLLLGAGLALSTGFWLVSAAAMLALVAWGVSRTDKGILSGRECEPAPCQPRFLMETGVTIGVGLVAGFLHMVQGLLPLL